MSAAIYIQGLNRRFDGEIVSKCYKIEISAQTACSDYSPDDVESLYTCDIHRGRHHLRLTEKSRCGNFLVPEFDGPSNGLGSCASVVSGSTIYVIGGVEKNLHLTEKNRHRQPSEFLTNKLYYRDLGKPDKNRGWKEGPPMIMHRGGMHAAIVNDKIYVFGSSIRKWEGDIWGTEIWSPWAEFFDLSSFEWNSMPDPKLPMLQPDPTGHAISDNGKEILVYCKYTDDVYAYNTEKTSWKRKSSIGVGCYHIVTSMDGNLYGAGRVGPDMPGYETIYAFDLRGPSEMPVEGLKGIPDTVLPSGLIPLDKDVLCVLTGHTIDNLFNISCSIYRISRTYKVKKGIFGFKELINVSSKLLSHSNYYINGLISVENCLLVGTFGTSDNHKARGGRSLKNVW